MLNEILTLINLDDSVAYETKRRYKKAPKVLKKYLSSNNETCYEKCIEWTQRLQQPEYIVEIIRTLLNTIFTYAKYGVLVSTNNCFGINIHPYIERSVPVSYISIIDEYIESKKYKKSFGMIVKRTLVEFVYIIEAFGSSIETLGYNELDKYYQLKLDAHGDTPSFHHHIQRVCGFLKYCSEFEMIDRLLGLFLMDKYYSYYSHMIKIMRNVSIPNNLKGSSVFDPKIYDDDNIKIFKMKYKDNKYVRCNNKFHNEGCPVINKFRIFAEVNNLPLNKETVEFWTEHVIHDFYASFHEHRLIMLRFHEMVVTGTVTFKPIINNELNYDSIPLWSKKEADEYIEYRVRLGYSESTISMDKNSLARFLKYIDNLGIHSYEQIDEIALKSFNENDPHKTVEGKNAYLVRIKGFLRFMHEYHDTKPLYLSIFLAGSRVPQKIVTVADEEFLQVIKGYTHNNSNAIDYRDYAIYLLALHVGLRASDIVSLKFTSVSFTDMSIKIIQTKTLKEIITNMPIEVANRYLQICEICTS